MNGKTFRPDRHQLLFEIFLLRHMQRKVEFPARTTDIKRLIRHLFRRDNHIFRGHSLRRMGSHHPAVFQPPEILRKPDRGQFPPVGIQQKIFVSVARRNRQTAVVDLVFRSSQIHGKTDNITFPDRQGNSVPGINTVADCTILPLLKTSLPFSIFKTSAISPGLATSLTFVLKKIFMPT